MCFSTMKTNPLNIDEMKINFVDSAEHVGLLRSYMDAVLSVERHAQIFHSNMFQNNQYIHILYLPHLYI